MTRRKREDRAVKCVSALLMRGTASPMVKFRQLSSVVSTPEGSGTAVVFGSFPSATVLLYPSNVNTTLLAR